MNTFPISQAHGSPAEFILDLNQIASRESVLIPEGTYAKVQLAIRPEGCGLDRMLTKAKSSDFLYLNTILVVCSGPLTGRGDRAFAFFAKSMDGSLFTGKMGSTG